MLLWGKNGAVIPREKAARFRLRLNPPYYGSLLSGYFVRDASIIVGGQETALFDGYIPGAHPIFIKCWEEFGPFR